MEGKIRKKMMKVDHQSIRLIRNIGSSFIIKGLSMILSLFTMPAYIKFFDNQSALGMWFTAISMLSWILTFDLGIGNGLRNHLVKPLVENDYNEVKRYISSSYISIASIVLIVIVLGNIIIPYIDWNNVFNISRDIVNEDTILFMVKSLFIGIMISFLLKLVTSILYALQKPAIPGLLNLLTSIILLIYMYIFKSNNINEDIKVLSIVNSVAINIPLIGSTIIVFTTRLKKCKPSLKFYNVMYSFKVLKLGGIFFWVQIMSMMMFGTNEFLITWLSKPEDVVSFQLYNKIFMILCTLFNLALTPVWSEVREAYVRNDFNWINRLYKKLNIALLLLVPIQGLIIIYFDKIIKIWVGSSAIEVNILYSILFSVYSLIYMKVSIDTSIIAGLGNLKIQSFSLTVSTIIKIFICIVIMKNTNSWIGIIIANILSLIPYIIIESLDIKKQILNEVYKENVNN